MPLLGGAGRALCVSGLASTIQPMKSDDPYPLSGAQKSSVGPKVIFVAVVCLTIGLIAGIKWKEKNAPEPVIEPQVRAEVVTPKSLPVAAIPAPEAPKSAPVPVVSNAEVELEKKNAELMAANERLTAQLKAQADESERTAKKAKEAEEQQATAKSQRLLNQIVLKLERVRDEADNFSSYSHAGELAREESRLKTLASEQENQARSIVADMKEVGFPDADKLERLIKDFTRNYGYYVAAKNTSWKLTLLSGQISQEAQANVNEYQKKYYMLLSRIKMFPREMPDIL